MLNSETRFGHLTREWSGSGSQRGLDLTVLSSQELVLFVSAFLTLWWEGAAEVRDLSLPQPPLASSHRLAKRRMLWPGTLLQQECVLAAVLSGLWRSSLGGNLELGFQVSGEEDLA